MSKVKLITKFKQVVIKKGCFSVVIANLDHQSGLSRLLKFVWNILISYDIESKDSSVFCPNRLVSARRLSVMHSLTTEWRKMSTSLVHPKISSDVSHSHNIQHINREFWFQADSDTATKVGKLTYPPPPPPHWT